MSWWRRIGHKPTATNMAPHMFSWHFERVDNKPMDIAQRVQKEGAGPVLGRVHTLLSKMRSGKARGVKFGHSK